MESQIRTLLWGYTEAGKYNYYIYFHDGYDDRQKMRFTALNLENLRGRKLNDCSIFAQSKSGMVEWFAPLRCLILINEEKHRRQKDYDI